MRADRARGGDPIGRAFARAERVSSLALGVVCVVLTGIIALVDASVTPLLALSVFYLLPVLVAASRGVRFGMALAVLTSAAWCTVDLVKHGSLYDTALVPLGNALSRLVVFTVVVLLVAALRRDRQREAANARRDQLTGLPNARSFYAAVEDARRGLARTGRPVTLAYLDLDDFKSVNDQLGHAAGDDVLRQAGAALASSVRAVDVVARLGGDEFAVLLPETSRQAAAVLLPRVHERMTQAMAAATSASTSSADAPVVRVSIGAVTFDSPPDSVDQMVSAADNVMYEVKRSGKNRVLLTP